MNVLQKKLLTLQPEQPRKSNEQSQARLSYAMTQP